MRVVDLDRDMSDVFPTGTSIDSEFLFRRMEDATLDAMAPGPTGRVVDVAAGVGQDDRAAASRGWWVVGVEPSERMTALARLSDARADDALKGEVHRLRGWSEALPFADDSFDGSFCKGALDHFDDPASCIREMCRVTRPDGRVVLAVANFDSLAVRLARAFEAVRETLFPDRAARARGRRHSDVPSDHFTRYDPELLRRQLSDFATIEQTTGVSLLWGIRSWARLLGALPPRVAGALLQLSDRIAARVPGLADVIVLSARPSKPATAREPRSARQAGASAVESRSRRLSWRAGRSTTR